MKTFISVFIALIIGSSAYASNGTNATNATDMNSKWICTTNAIAVMWLLKKLRTIKWQILNPLLVLPFLSQLKIAAIALK